MNRELNESTAKAIGYQKLEGGAWVNSWGGSVNKLPDFSGNKRDAEIIVRHFEPTLQTRIDGTYERFGMEYHEEMLPAEICCLALRVLSGK